MMAPKFLFVLTAFSLQSIVSAQTVPYFNNSSPTATDSAPPVVIETEYPVSAQVTGAGLQRGGGDGYCDRPPVTVEICGKHCPCEGRYRYVWSSPLRVIVLTVASVTVTYDHQEKTSTPFRTNDLTRVQRNPVGPISGLYPSTPCLSASFILTKVTRSRSIKRYVVRQPEMSRLCVIPLPYAIPFQGWGCAGPRWPSL